MSTEDCFDTECDTFRIGEKHGKHNLVNNMQELRQEVANILKSRQLNYRN